MYSTSDLRVQPDRFVPCFLLMSLFCRAVKDIDVWVLPGPQWGSFIILSSSVVGRHWQTMRGLVAPRLFWLVKLGDNNVYMKVSFFFFFLYFFFFKRMGSLNKSAHYPTTASLLLRSRISGFLFVCCGRGNYAPFCLIGPVRA